MAPQRRPPAASSAEPPSAHAFVNPADVYNRARLTDNYLWQVARKLSGYLYQAHVVAREGLTVVRIVIARDGRLLDVEVIRSSGVPEFDRGVLAGVRAGSPYAPLPPEMQGDRASFDLPLVSVNHHDDGGESRADSNRAVRPGKIGDVQRRHAGHLHQTAVVRAVGLEAVLDIAHFLDAVARLEAVGKDERRRRPPDVA